MFLPEEEPALLVTIFVRTFVCCPSKYNLWIFTLKYRLEAVQKLLQFGRFIRSIRVH